MSPLWGGGGILSSAAPVTDVLLVAGQSNAVGYGLIAADLPTHLQGSDSGIKIWNGSAFVTLINGSNNALLCVGTSSNQNWAAEAEFAYQYRQANPSKTFYIVKYAVSDTKLYNDGIANWNSAFRGSYFDQMATYISAAMASLSAINPPAQISWIDWMQGETDAQDSATEANAYAANLSALIAAIPGNWGSSATKMLVSRISSSPLWTFSAAVRAAESAVTLPTRWIDTDSYPRQADNAHYTATGQVNRGDDLWGVR